MTRFTSVSADTVNLVGLPAPEVVVPLTGARASLAASVAIRAQARLPLAAEAQATDSEHALAKARRAVTTVVVYQGSSRST
ncbi:MAG: hypothetical protein JO120_02020 [Solirubrobacterales bacterium]|nr:hypothetical protein [Solirubrobacterales bacterium]